jgi:hypothetical protein
LKELIQEKLSGQYKKDTRSAVEVGKLSDDQINFTQIKKDLEDQLADQTTRIQVLE